MVPFDESGELCWGQPATERRDEVRKCNDTEGKLDHSRTCRKDSLEHPRDGEHDHTTADESIIQREQADCDE